MGGEGLSILTIEKNNAARMRFGRMPDNLPDSSPGKKMKSVPNRTHRVPETPESSGIGEKGIKNDRFSDELARLRRSNAGLEKALRKSEEKFQGLLESASDAILILDTRGNVIDLNRTAHERLGYTREEMLSMHISQLDSPEFAARVPERLAQVTKYGHAVFESAHVRKDGTVMPVEVNARVADCEGERMYFGIIRDITGHKRAEDGIRASLREKEVLLREVHHRVKNNMAVIHSLLGLQSRYVKDGKVREMFEESQNRIKSMALIHEKLYQSEDVSDIDIRKYVRELAGGLIKSRMSGTGGVGLSVRVERIHLDIDTLIPCGLIINELVTNSLKHAFKGIEKPEIRISLGLENGQATLLVGDNGRGFPGDVDFRNAGTLGLQLVSSLVSQLGGRIELDGSNGTVFRVSFELPGEGNR